MPTPMKPALLPIDEIGRLAALERYIALDAPPSTAFDHLTRLTSAIFDVPIALVSMVDVQSQWFKARFGLDVESTSRDISFCAHAILDDEVFVVLDASLDERFADNPLVTGSPHIRFYAGAPLRTPDGFRIGTLCVIDSQPRAEFTASEQEMLQQLAAIVVDEFELQLTTAELRVRDEELRRYYEVMGASTDFIGIVDPEGALIGLNPAARAMIGLGLEESLAGRRMSDFHTGEANRLIKDVGLDVAREQGSWRGETELLTADGRTIPVDQVLLCHRDANGAITFTSTIIRDISDRNEIARLRQLQVMKDEFVSTVSHELRTPLSSIIASLEMLSDGVVGPLDEGVEEIVDVAITNSNRLLRLIDELLDLERLDAGLLELHRRSVEVCELVDAAEMTVGATALAAGIGLRRELFVPDGQTVMCDVDRMTRALVNLIGNAVKFSGAGSTITVRAEVLDESLVLTVIDEGIGIDHDLIPRLFDPFWQVDSSASRAAGGTGLGLAITRRIIARHGGEIEVESELGRGSAFRVLIPLEPAD